MTFSLFCWDILLPWILAIAGFVLILAILVIIHDVRRR